MSVKQQINNDLKQAMLAGDKHRVDVLRTIKSSILDTEIAANARESGLSDDQIIKVLQKETKKRTEAAEMYRQGNSEKRAAQEEAEKVIIATYLPPELSHDELLGIIQDVIDEIKPGGLQDMGKVIGLVKERSRGQADGSRIAAAVKEQLKGWQKTQDRRHNIGRITL